MDPAIRPLGLRWRASTPFILVVVAFSLFTDLFLYGLIVPVLPFALTDLLHIPEDQIQAVTSGLLAAEALASVLFSPIAGLIADHGKGRVPFLFGLVAMSLATALLCFGRTLLLLVIARILQGVSAAIVWTVGLSLVMDTVGVRKLGTSLGSIYGVISVGSLASPTLGGIVYARLGYYAVYGLAGIILLFDIFLRLAVIERSVANQYFKADDDPVTERTSLIRDDDSGRPIAQEPEPTSSNFFVRSFPLLSIMSNTRLLSALFVTFAQASLLATFDATVPLHAKKIFGMDSLQSGLLFMAIQLPYIITGPIFGRWVETRGGRPAALFGSLLLVPTLILLRIPDRPSSPDAPIWPQKAYYVALLTFAGIGLSAIGGPALVEASTTVSALYERRPGLFGPKGPYGQLYAVNNIVFSLGMTVGPMLSGTLTDGIGYGNAMAIMSLLALLSALVAFAGLGSRKQKGKSVVVVPTHDD